MRGHLIIAIALAFLGLSSFAKDHKGTEEVRFDWATIQVDGKNLKVEIAKTPAQHERGLMFRKHIGENEGMLFIFTDQQTRFFWMKNTFIPLSIGYFDESGKLIDLQDMTPVQSEMEQNPPTYKSRGLAKYALETSLGWFQKKKIGLGAKLVPPADK